MDKRELKLVAEAKQKEFDRLKGLVLNQMSLIEGGLNPASIGRNPYDPPWIIIPTRKDIHDLFDTLMELRKNLLTVEEKECLNE